MSAHFLLSPAAKTLSLGAVMRMSDREAEDAFVRIRWHATDGRPVCPHCGCEIVYSCRKADGPARWRCKACRKDFSATSGTLFAFHKLSLREYLAAIAIFCNEEGRPLLVAADLAVDYKTAFVLTHKLREAMATESKGLRVGGPGRVVETDGAYFGGYVKPANRRENRVDRRFAENKTGKRKVVVVVRERDGRTLPAVFKSESAALGHHVARGQGHPHDGRRGAVVERTARQVRHGSDRPRAGVQHAGRRLHERSGGVFLPHAPGRNRPPSPHR